MKKYLVKFTTKDGEYDKERCRARSEEEATVVIQINNRNISHIDHVEEL